MSDITFTQEEVDALVAAAIAKATAPLAAELETFKAGQQSAEVEAQIAAVREEMEAQVTDLTSKLDAAVLDAETAKTERDSIKTWLDEKAAEAVAEVELAAVKETRIAAVAAVVSFPDDYVAERAQKWALLNDEDFEALLADYKALGEKSKPGSESGGPKSTAMVGTREVASAGNSKMGSAMKDLIQNRLDPRAIR